VTALTAPQAAALRYVDAVNRSDGNIPATPRDDVLKRLAAKGLVTRTVTARREPNWDRYRFDARHTLTEAGKEALR
jgi:hypothetical protein